MKSYLEFFRTHERVILAVVIALAILWGYGRWVDHDSQKAHDANVIAQQALEAQKQQNAQFAAISAQYAEQFKAISARVDLTNAKLDADIAARRQQVQNQQQADAQYPLPQLADRWNFLLGTTGAKAEPKQIVTDEPTARTTVQQLELVPALQQDVKDKQKQLDGEKEKTEACRVQVDAQNDEIGGLNTQISLGKTACEKQVADEKAKARKGKLKWLKIGAVAGAVAVEVIRVVFTGKP